MNTLGVRGLALAKTLQEYDDAATNAAKVKSIGLDPEEMHRVAEQMKVLDMQAGQLKNAGGAALAPLANDLFPPLIEGLASTARWLQTNKELVQDTAKSALELIAVYKTVQTAQAAYTGLKSLAGTGTSETAAAASDTAITAAQERSIDRRMKLLDRAAQKEIATYQRTAEYKAMTEEQKVAAVTQYTIEVSERYAALAEQERATMVAAYESINAVAANSAIAQTASFEAVGAAATVSAEKIVASNAVAAESTGVYTLANADAAESELAKGAASTEAGVKIVAANGAATESAAVLTAANVKVGTTALASGSASAVAMAEMKTAARSAASTVWTLAGGWLGVAAAIGFAIIKLHEYQMAELKKEQENTVTWNGETYIKQGEDFYKKNGYELTSNSSDLYNANTMFGTTSETAETGTSKDTLEALWKLKQPETAEDRLKKQKDALTVDASSIDALKAALATTGDKAEKAGTKVSEAAEKQAKTYQIQVPLGQEVLDQARARIGTPYEWGGAGDDLGNISTDCGKLVLDSFRAAGVQFTSRVVPDMVAEAGAAYHDAASGYIPQAGDAAIVNPGSDRFGHIVISNGRGGYVGANSSTGVQEHASLTSDFGQPTGYISIAELTGGRTIAKTVTEDGKLANEALNKLNQAKTDYYNLNASFLDEINKSSSDYAANMTQVTRTLASRNAEINKLAAAGLDVSTLKANFQQYQQIVKDNVTKKWQDAVDAIRLDTKKTLAATNDDYKTAAEAEYEIALKKLDEERTVRLKSVALYKGDMQAQLEVDSWYNAQALALGQKKDEALRESHAKTIEAMANKGDVAGLKTELNGNSTARQQDLTISGSKALAQEYVTIWDEAHKSMQENIADSTKTLYSGMTNTIYECITGTKGAMETVASFGQLVLQTFAQIAAQKIASNIALGMMNSFGGGGGGMAYSGNASWSGSGVGGNSFGLVQAMGFADGGIVSAPTLGLIGEVPGTKELVMPLTDSNLKAIGGGSNRSTPIINNFYTKDANSFKKSQASVAAALAGAVARGRRFL